MQRFIFATALALSAASAQAADVTVQPAAGSGFVVKDAAGANERLRVQESGAITLPGVPGAVAQTIGLCVSSAGLLGPCLGGGGGGGGNGALPAGTVNQTLRYDASNALVANSELQVFADGGVLATDAAVNAALVNSLPNAGSPPASGPGARMMWYPAKAAFRAGWVDGTQWDGGQIGRFSFATGAGTTAKGYGAIAMGGQTLANQTYSTAMGEKTNATGYGSTAMGSATTAEGDYSTAMGSHTYAYAASVAMGSNVSSNPGSFTFGDAALLGQVTTRGTGVDNSFSAYASGGVTFFTGPNSSATLAPGSGTWSNLSDRNAKTAVAAVDTRAVLEKVAAMPLNTWQYKTQNANYRHMGPMAQDFYAAFQLGESDTGIDTVDADGVALAAIQGLSAKLTEIVDARDREIAVLEHRLAAQDETLAALSRQFTQMHMQLQTLQSHSQIRTVRVVRSQRRSARDLVATAQP